MKWISKDGPFNILRNEEITTQPYHETKPTAQLLLIFPYLLIETK